MDQKKRDLFSKFVKVLHFESALKFSLRIFGVENLYMRSQGFVEI